MNEVERYKKEADSEHTAYTRFMLNYDPRKTESLYCFFEGNDDVKYYGFRIKSNTKRDITFATECNGKDNVKKIASLIGEKVEYKNAITLFFLDKNYSSDITAGDIYVTPCYSVENFYTSIDTIKEVLIFEFKLAQEGEDFVKVIETYTALKNIFHEKLLLFNSWLCCQYDLRTNRGEKTYLEIDDAIKKQGVLKKIVKDSLDDIHDLSKLNDINFIENILFPNAPKIEQSVLDKKISLFKNAAQECIFRGKFELMFIISFLDKLKNEIGNRKTTVFKKKHKCNLRFEYCTAISVLSQYAQTPNCLLEYLEKYKTDT